jgi:hypothetical protein
LYYTDQKVMQYLQLGFGLGAILAAAASQGAIRNAAARSAQRHARRIHGPAGKRKPLPRRSTHRLSPLSSSFGGTS